jgi:hypothetical protein
MTGCLLAVGCTPTVAPLIDVVSTGTSTQADVGAETPDDALRQLATTGINVGVLLGPLIKQYAGLASAFYAARSTYSKAAYGVLDIPGWEFQNGWYVQHDDATSRTLRAQFEDTGGRPVTWDVTLPSNYDPDLHAAFPAELTQIRLEVDLKLPGTGRIALSMFAPMNADSSASIEAFGSGSATLAVPLGQASFEALNASFRPGSDVDRGQIGLKSLAGAATLQFSGQFVKTGLASAAKLVKNGHAAGTVDYDATSGHWQITNAKGAFPL